MPIQLERVITPLPHREGQGVGLFFLFQNLLSVLLHLDLLGAIDFCDDALFVDDKRRANGAHIGAASHLLLLPHAESLYKTVVGVSNQGEGQLEFLLELQVRLLILHAHANDGKASLEQLLVVVAQAAGLARAAGRGVLRIEIQHQFAAGEVAESQFVTILVAPQQFGGLVSNL